MFYYVFDNLCCFFCKLKVKRFTNYTFRTGGVWENHVQIHDLEASEKNQDFQDRQTQLYPKNAASFSIPVLPGGIIFGNLGSLNLPGGTNSMDKGSISSAHYSAMV